MTAKKWGQMAAGLICMLSISSPQYVWTLFTPHLRTELSLGAPALQVTFSILIVVQTLFSPVQGWIARHVVPRVLIGAGVIVTGLSWVAAAQVHSLAMLYMTYGLLGGIGTGIVYVGVVSLLMEWFPENRGMAAGMGAAGYGMGAMLTTFPIAHMMAASGWRSTMVVFGLLIAVTGTVAACFLYRPDAHALSTRQQVLWGANTAQVVRSPIFWLMFFMMATMATSGLMVTSQLAQIAADKGIAHLMVWGMAALPLAMTLDRIANGLTRPMFGWISDRIGRELTMTIAFMLEAVALACWIGLSSHPVLFVLLSGVVFLGWGEIFSLFPATLTDTFGTRDASRNYGILYMAQGVGAILGGPLAAWLHEATGGNWGPVFACAIGGDILTATLAFAVLRPMRKRYMARSHIHS
ncbi:oxalate/formate MFS antiporter [Komagataeibacter oboediens]|uniref:Oxalate/formate MFS antiporter n=1 Tax=Komagataeibacter oboediens TaxID=65958 RepID=A0ABS5SNX0_9PROT|nr:oxalate/formate MFS antiporter [Komagataeibacter oboediens]MBL7233090.1 oxalate/formate MFS antiporter [Komagataeibacter oboediens]MBT0675889.1 oxalate/formate MFS antiporter [Komagataeibacter oboediens]MBT0677763.1 oxalate/formate MFS antiporter [Komagataeibacter oboediens]